jgi:phosphate transport system permease protein
MKKDLLYRMIIGSAAFMFIALVAGILITLIVHSFPAFKSYGLRIFFHTEWNVGNDQLGVFPFVLGTLVTSGIALALSIPVGTSIGLFIGEYSEKTRFGHIISSIIEILAAIPSVIYGFWGIIFLVPIVRETGYSMGFSVSGTGLLTASLVLSLMIIPIISSFTSEVVKNVPQPLKESALSLGATRTEMVFNVVLPSSIQGIAAGIVLALGRAIGETIAVTMLVGNSMIMPSSIFDPSNTMSSLIITQFDSASGIYFSVIMEVALILFVITTLLNLGGRNILKKITGENLG